MTLLARINPFRPMPFDPFAEIEDVMRVWPTRTRGEPAAGMDFRVDVEEDAAAYTVRAEMPGVKREDIEVSIDHDVVRLAFVLRRERELKDGERALLSERSYGRAFRAFTLPHPVDDEKTQARFEGGVLTLTLPKKANGQTRRIKVS